MKVAVIEYKAGNTHSVVHALRRVGAEPLLTADPAEITAAARVILPGQGEASHVMRALRDAELDEVVRGLRQPVLGICIGQQIFCEHTAEGDTRCLGIYPGARVEHFGKLTARRGLKIPHTGWNTLHGLKTPLFRGIAEGEYVYFVHSFCVPMNPWAAARTEYGGVSFAAAMQRDNFYATQFHPEKSGRVGEQILRNFLTLTA